MGKWLAAMVAFLLLAVVANVWLPRVGHGDRTEYCVPANGAWHCSQTPIRTVPNRN